MHFWKVKLGDWWKLAYRLEWRMFKRFWWIVLLAIIIVGLILWFLNKNKRSKY